MSASGPRRLQKSFQKDTSDDSKQANRGAQINQVKNGIRECLVRLEPAISAYKRPPNIETALYFLEEMDEASGGQDAFRAWMRSTMEASLRKLVRAEVQLQCRETSLTPEKMKMVAPAILSKILETSEMKACVDHLQRQTISSASNMTSNFEYELVLLSQLRGKENPATNRESDVDSLGSSTASNFAFLQTGQFTRLAEQLNPYMGSESRIEALKLMLQAQFCDIVGSPEWKQIKEGLRLALTDVQTPAVSSLALKVHARMLGNMTPFCTKEAFVNIVDTLTRMYKDKTRSNTIPVKDSDVLFKRRSHSNLLHIYKLLVSACTDLPRFWIRYPEMYVTEIVKAMLDLAAFHDGRPRNRTPNVLTPSDFLSLVDPQAKWLQSWLHSKFGRCAVFSELKQNDTFVKLAIQNLNQSLDVQKQTPHLIGRGSSKGKGVLSSQLQTFSTFVYSLKVVTLIMNSKKGVELLSDVQDYPALTPEGIILTLTSFNFHSNQKNATAIITQSLIELLSRDHVVRAMMNQRQFLKALTLPLMLWEDEIKSATSSSSTTMRAKEAFQTLRKNSTSPHTVTNVLTVFDKLLENPTGVNTILRTNIESKKPVLISDFLLQLTISAFSKYQTQPPTCLILLSSVSARLLTHDGAMTKLLPSLVQVLAETFADLDYETSCTPTNVAAVKTAQVIREQSNKALLKQIASVFGSIMETPRGALIVSSSGIVDGVLRHLQPSLKPEILLHLSVTESGAEILRDIGIIEQYLVSVQEASSIEKFGHHVFCHPSPEEIDEFTDSNIQLLCGILSSPPMVWKSESDDVFRRLVTLEDVDVATDDDALALKLVLSVCSSIDSSCYVQHKFKVFDTVRNLKEDPNSALTNAGTVDNSGSALDNETLLCNFIVTFLAGIGGSREKTLPKLNFQDPRPKTLAPKLNEKVDRDAAFVEKSSLREELISQQLQSGQLEEYVLLEFFEAISKTSDCVAPDHFTLTEEQKLAAKLFSEYCPHLTLEHIEQVSSLCFGENSVPRFDWFAALALHIFDGNFERCKTFLLKFWNSEKSSFLWPKKLGINGSLLIAHHVEAILLSEEPMLYQTMHEAGISVALIVDHWISQMFINALNLHDIVNYIGIVIYFGVEFVAYFCVSVFVHLRDEIMDFRIGSRQRDRVELFFILKVLPVEDFAVEKSLIFMKYLESKFKISLSPAQI